MTFLKEIVRTLLTQVTSETSLNMSIGAFLTSLGLEQLREVFDR